MMAYPLNEHQLCTRLWRGAFLYRCEGFQFPTLTPKVKCIRVATPFFVSLPLHCPFVTSKIESVWYI